MILPVQLPAGAITPPVGIDHAHIVIYRRAAMQLCRSQRVEVQVDQASQAALPLRLRPCPVRSGPILGSRGMSDWLAMLFLPKLLA